MKTLLSLSFVVAVASLAAAQAPAPAATPCTSVKDLQVICGQQGPEDLVAVDGGQWVIASAMAGSGGINVIRVSDRQSSRAYPSPTAKDRLDAKTYPGCPGPPDAPGAMFTTHGLWLGPRRGGVQKLFVVGHGSREAIEVFDVDARGGTPALTWIGCAVAPDPIGLNSVRGLPDGGFITSNFQRRGGDYPAERRKLMAGEKNGELWEWHTKSGWQKVPGSESAGANGLEMSADGKWLYVSLWGSQSVMRLSRGRTPAQRDEVPLGFRIDNIRRAPDGSLFGTGQGQQATDIVRIDPKTMKVTKLVHRADDASFRSGTVALQVGGGLWVGSFQGDRIAVLQAP